LSRGDPLFDKLIKAVTMKRLMPLVFVLCCLCIGLKAQDYRMVSFTEMTNSMIAREHMKEDDNGRKCAVICIATQDIEPEKRKDFYFESDWGSYIVQKTLVEPEIWVWVSPGLKTLIIRHPLGKIEVPVTNYIPTIESMHTYKMVLKGTMKKGPDNDPVITQQFLMIKVTPKDALVTVDGKPWQVIDGTASNLVDFGRHEYRIEAKDYHTVTRTVTVDESGGTVTEEIDLKPAFGYLKLEGNTAILEKSSIFVDNANASEALKTPLRLASGQHKLRIVNAKYKAYERDVVISDGETNTLNVNLDANFSTITLKVDADADIYVNNVRKGTRTWTGDLEAGNYLIECRQKSHRTTKVQKNITDRMSGQTIQLDAPQPINGVLNVNSNPPMAKIIIDGADMGETPKQFKAILIGEHILRLEKQGCAPLVKTITIEEGKTLTLNEKLDTGRSVLVKTDRQGDKIYVDDQYVGETPRETPLSFGRHTIRVMRNGVKVEKDANITENSRNGQEMMFEFGRLIAISTDQSGDVVMVDGVKVGVSPLSVDLPYGSHTIHAERGKKYADKDINVQKSGGETSHRLVLHGETLDHFLKNGINFATLDFAYSPAPQTSFGATLGSVRKIGWFVSAASNFQFDAMSAELACDSEGLVDGDWPAYSGETSNTRVSLMGGLVAQVAGPFCLRLGAGYGSRTHALLTTDGNYVKVADNSFSGIDATAGMQFNLKGFTMSFDAITTNFKTLEVKVGLGYCWKRK